MNRPATVTTSAAAPDATSVPDTEGHFGAFGGSFIPETLHKAVAELGEVYAVAKDDPAFQQQMTELNRDYIGRATPLQFAPRLTEKAGGAQIWIKREDLAHTGAHKINNAIGQCLLTIRMGKHRIIAETGAGQHGVATATAAAKFGLDCEVFMGTEDMRRQRPNVLRMRLMGAKVTGVESGSKTLKDATNAAMRDWMATSENTHYTIGSVVGPHPFPMIVRDFQSVIGKETYGQCLDQLGRLPDCITACVGGGSNAAGMFHPFATNPDAQDVKLVGVEPGGVGTEFGKHAASLSYGEPGVLHGSLSYVLQDHDGQTAPVHSVSAGLDYPGVGPEHAYWKDSGRVTYASVTDTEALDAFQLMSKLEGILPALECSHAMAHTLKLAADMPKDQIIVMNLSGRGDKDLDEVVRVLKM
ncbi:MAG: tryptophan synthase subunit beta [Planctomycetota bacterium]